MKAFIGTAGALAVLFASHTLYGATVVVFPLDGRGVARDTADGATLAVKKTLTAIPGVEVIETTSVEKKLGIHLTEQAHACEYDTFCLVEVGEIIGGDRLLIGHVRRGAKEMKKDEIELKLFVLDVAKASVVDTLLWRFTNVPGALEEATRAATKKLFAPPDAQISLQLSPPNADVSMYGEPLSKPKTQPFGYWAGTWQVHVAAEGRVAQDLRIDIPSGGPTTIAVELQPDLLYTGKPKVKATTTPFDKSSRREGSGVSADEVGVAISSDQPERRSAWLNPIAWSISGVGVAAAVVGFVMSSSAQSDYNRLSGQTRYLGATLPSTDAIGMRDDDRAKFKRGAYLSAVDAVALVGGLAWMFVDSVTHDRASQDSGAAATGGKPFVGEVAW